MKSETRPWGEFTVLFKGPDFQVKRIELKPGLRFSLQKHFKRAEKWVVVSGSGAALIGPKLTPVSRGSMIDVPVEAVHRMHNTGSEPLVFIEVQFGEYLGEDDIVRLEDDYSRV